jgi:hypothetical protein
MKWGNKLKVRVKDDGGFQPDVPGTYIITLYATHPLSGEKYYSECTITVEAAEEILEPAETTLTGTSDSVTANTSNTATRFPPNCKS